MKKISLSLFLILFVSAANAQEFKKFRWGLGLGYAVPGGKGAKGGVLFYSEPGYRINDQILVNLRMEFAVMARGYSESVADANFGVSTAGSYTLNGQYYLSNNGFRPFVGLGFGIYSIKAVTLLINGADVSSADQSKFGFYPRVGFDAKHFSMMLDYNLVGATKAASGSGKFINNYIGIRLGFFIGGGRK